MTPKQICQQHGIDGVTELAKIVEREKRSLYQWAKDQPKFFSIVVRGAAEAKKESVQ